MTLKRFYRNSGLPVSEMGKVTGFLAAGASAALGDPWGHKLREFVLFYDDQKITCDGYEEMKTAVASRGDTPRYSMRYESKLGRLICVDSTDGTRLAVEVENTDKSLSTLAHIETILQLKCLPRRVFLSHGRSTLWTRVQTFIEREMHRNLEAIEFEQQPSGGRTIADKLRAESEKCSFAVIVMTGDDLDDKGNPHVRENVMHEIGFFQGRYGFDRICLLREDGVTIPSNLHGFLYVPFQKGDVTAALVGLQKELLTAFPLA